MSIMPRATAGRYKRAKLDKPQRVKPPKRTGGADITDGGRNATFVDGQQVSSDRPAGKGSQYMPPNDVHRVMADLDALHWRHSDW